MKAPAAAGDGILGIEWVLTSSDRARILYVRTPGFRSLRDLHPGLYCGALSALGSSIAATFNTSVTKATSLQL